MTLPRRTGTTVGGEENDVRENCHCSTSQRRLWHRPPLALGGRIPGARLGVLLGVLARSFALERRDFLLRPLKVAADLTRITHAVLETLARPRQARLCLLLELEELAVLGVQLAGSVSVLARLSLDSHAAVQGDGVEGVGVAVLHVFLKVDAAGGLCAVVITGGGAGHVASRGGGVDGRDGRAVMAHGLFVTVHGGGRVLAVGRVLVALASGRGHVV